jgi:hypothetical protein
LSHSLPGPADTAGPLGPAPAGHCWLTSDGEPEGPPSRCCMCVRGLLQPDDCCACRADRPVKISLPRRRPGALRLAGSRGEAHDVALVRRRGRIAVLPDLGNPRPTCRVREAVALTQLESRGLARAIAAHRSFLVARGAADSDRPLDDPPRSGQVLADHGQPAVACAALARDTAALISAEIVIARRVSRAGITAAGSRRPIR